MALEELSSHESRLPPPSPATSLPPSAALGADGEPPPEEETVGGLGADGRQLGQAGAAPARLGRAARQAGASIASLKLHFGRS